MSKHHDPELHCHHISPRGQRCRMLSAPHHDSFCANHLKQSAATRPDPEILAAHLLGQTGGLSTAGEVNALLANVAKQFAHQRIDRKDAIAFAYLSQLLLCTLPGMEKVLEAEREAHAIEATNKDVAEMRARFLAHRIAANAREAARNSQNNPSAETRSSSGPSSHSAKEFVSRVQSLIRGEDRAGKGTTEPPTATAR